MLEISSLKKTACQIREDVLTMVHKAGSGHPGGSLSAVEIMTVLYFGGVMRVDPESPQWKERDCFVLSKGHVAPVLYSTLARKGFFGTESFDGLRKLGSILQGHPHAELVPGLDTSSGSLGQGLSVACGMALGKRRQGLAGRIYCLLGDGELQEGQVWEAALSAAQWKLANLCAIVDNNHVQLDGRTEDIKKMEPVADKWRAFGWNVVEVDGHNMPALHAAFTLAEQEKNRPTVLVAETIKGKGISFMENRAEWHGLAPDATQLAACIDEINTARRDI